MVQEAEPVQAEAFEDTLVCALYRDDFLGFIRRQPELMLTMMKVLAERLRVAEEEIADLVFRDVPGRLASQVSRTCVGLLALHIEVGGWSGTAYK